MSELPLIGDIKISPKKFSRQDEILTQFKEGEFKSLPSPERNEIINRTLLDFIHETPAPALYSPKLFSFWLRSPFTVYWMGHTT